MATITKTVRVVTRDAKRTSPGTERLWRAIEIEFATGQVEWIVSHTASIGFLPAGSSVSGARLIGQSDYSRNCGYLSGKSTISSPSYTIQDADNDLSDEFATKLVNGIGTYNRVIREYEWDAGTALPLSNGSPRFGAKGTWLFRDHTSKDYGTTVTINCADINRGLDAEVFNPMKWTLDHTVQATNDDGEHVFAADQTTFTTNISAADFTANPELYWRPFEHGDHYHEQPGQTGTYMALEATGQNGKRKENIWASNMRVDNGRVVFDAVRGQLLTSAQEFTVSGSTSTAQGPKGTEWIYFDEVITTAYRGLIVGDFNGRALPSHWTVSAPDIWVDKVAIAEAGEEMTVEFQNPGKTKLKAFLEKEILPVTLSVAPVNNVGALAYRRHEIAFDAGQSTVVFNESTCVTSKNYSLKHKKDQIFSAIRIEYNWDPHSKQFLSETIYYSPESSSFNQINRTKTIQLKGLTSAAHTDEIVRRLGGLHGNAHFFEQQEISIESYINDIPLGEVVYVNFTKPLVIDDANGSSTAQPLKRAFTVIAAKETRNTTTYTLRGTLEKATDFIKTTQQFNLDTDRIINTQSGAIDLTAGVNSGSITLNVGEFHYYKGNLTIPNTTTITPVGTSNKPTVIFVEGYFDCSANIDLSGRGARRIADGATASIDANDGEVGFVGGQDSTYGYQITNHTRIQNLGTSDFGNSEGDYISTGKFSLKAVQRNNMAKARSDVFGITVSNVDGRIEGIPTSLTGSSGAGAPRSVLLPYLTGNTDSPVSTTAQYIDGSDGGQAGGSLVIISRGGVMNGVVNTSGTEGATPNFITLGLQKFYGAKGGSGEPSPWIWIIDGNHTRPIINSSNFHAYLPDSGYVDGRYPQPADFVSFDGANPVHPNVPVNDDPNGTNLWATRHQIINIGESESLQRLPVYESSAAEQAEQIINFLENQTDGQVKLTVSVSDPSNGDVGDMVITQTNVNDVNNLTPPFRVLTATGWEDYVYGSSDLEGLYLALIAGQRRYGSTTVLVSTSRPTEFTAGDIWFNPDTDLSYILNNNQAFDRVFDLGQIQSGNNVYADGRFTLQRQFGEQWVFLSQGYTTLPILNEGTVPTHDRYYSTVLPSWGTYVDHNDANGRYGPQLSPQGVNNVVAIAPRFAAVGSGARRVIGRFEYKSSINTYAGNQGFALVVFALKRDAAGNISQIWWNDPFSSTDSPHVIRDNDNTWKRGQIVVDIPPEYDPDFIATAWAVRADVQNGNYVWFNSLEAELTNETNHEQSISAANWSNAGFFNTENLGPQQFLNNNSSVTTTLTYYIRYLVTQSVNIPAGTKIEFLADMYANVAGITLTFPGSVGAGRTEMGFGVKFVNESGQSQFWIKSSKTDDGAVSASNSDIQNNVGEQFVAPESYVSAQPFVYLRCLQDTTNTTNINPFINHTGVNINMIASNAIGTGSV